MPFPFTHANGRICCSNIDYCCDACKPSSPRSALRSAEEFPIPDPYAAGIAKLQQEDAARTHTRTPAAQPAEMPLDANGIPDPYAAGLAQLRSENR